MVVGRTAGRGWARRESLSADGGDPATGGGRDTVERCAGREGMAEVRGVSKIADRGPYDSSAADRVGSGDADPVYHQRQRALCNTLEVVREDCGIAARRGEGASCRAGAGGRGWESREFLAGSLGSDNCGSFAPLGMTTKTSQISTTTAGVPNQ